MTTAPHKRVEHNFCLPSPANKDTHIAFGEASECLICCVVCTKECVLVKQVAFAYMMNNRIGSMWRIATVGIKQE